MPGIGAFISPGRSLGRALDRVGRADRLGFDSVYVTHIGGRDSLTTLMAYAGASERIRVGTGVVPIFAMLEPSGFGDELAGFDAGMAGDDPERATAALSDELLDSLAGIGDADAIRAKVREYEAAGVTSPCIGGIPGAGFDEAIDAVAELI